MPYFLIRKDSDPVMPDHIVHGIDFVDAIEMWKESYHQQHYYGVPDPTTVIELTEELYLYTDAKKGDILMDLPE